MSLIDDDRLESVDENESSEKLDCAQEIDSAKKVKFTYNGKGYSSFIEYTRDYIINQSGMKVIKEADYAIEEPQACPSNPDKSEIIPVKNDAEAKPGMRIIKEADFISEEPQICSSYPDDELARKAHDLLGMETSEELDRTVKSEETVFGYTRDEFDKLYEETHGFNETCPDSSPISDMKFGDFLKEGSELIKNGHVRTKDGKDLRKYL